MRQLLHGDPDRAAGVRADRAHPALVEGVGAAVNALRPVSASRDLQEELAQVIGQANVDKLIERLGGTRTYVPAAMGVHHPLAVVIGVKAAARLAEFYHGQFLDLPKAHLRRQRALETALDRPPGMTLKAVALAFDYTERQIYKLLADHKKAGGDSSDQHDLFEPRDT